jgi:outer membrane protein assembly factor BamB
MLAGSGEDGFEGEDRSQKAKPDSICTFAFLPSKSTFLSLIGFNQRRDCMNKKIYIIKIVLGIAIIASFYGCSSTGAQFVDGLAAISGKGGTIARNDAYEPAKVVAKGLREYNPSTEWESIFPYEDADFIQFLNEERILIGSVEVGSALGMPDYEDIFLYDAKTGKMIWKSKRKSYSRGSYNVITTHPLIILLGRNEKELGLTAFDPSTGKIIWAHEVKAPYSFSFTEGFDKVSILSSNEKVELIDLKTGSILWSSNLSADFFKKDTEADLFISDDAIFVAGAKLVKLSIGTGQKVWTVAHALLETEGREIKYTKDRILLSGKDSNSLINPHNGSVAWESQLKSGGIKLTAVFGEMIFRVIGEKREENISKDYSDIIQAINLKTGKILWTSKTGGIVVSPLALEKKALLFTTDSSAVGLDISNGKRIFKTSFSEEMAAGSPSKSEYVGQPDILYFRSGNLYISREKSGLVALSLPNGKLIWAQENYHTVNKDIFYSADSRYKIMLADMAFHNYGKDSRPPSVGAYSFVSASPNYTLRIQQHNLEDMKTKADAALKRKDASQLERKSAIESKKMAADLGYAQLQMQSFSSQIETARDIFNAAVALNIGLAKALRDTAIQGLLSREIMQLNNCLLMRNKRFQGRYYIRPFYAEGRGITIIDLDNGKRSDFFFSPAMQVLLMYGVDMQTFALDPTEKRLIAVGIGLNSDKYEEYVKWKWRMPRPSLLAFNMSNLEFSKENMLIKRSLERVAKEFGQDALPSFAASGQIEIVRYLLDSGMDVNTKYSIDGSTALIMATIQANVEVVRLLIKAGANVNLKNNHGQRALFFTDNETMHNALGKTSKSDIEKYKEIRQMLLDAGAMK